MFIRHVINKSPTSTYDIRKCGMEWLGAAISASGSVSNTGLSSWMNRGDAHMAWRRNQGMQEDAQEFASEEAKKQRDWEKEEWLRQWELTSAYNSPAALRARYELAGMNPYMAMSNGMSGQVVSAPSAPAGASASAGVGSTPLGRGSSIDVASGVAEFAKAIESLSLAKKNATENDSIRKKLDAEIEGLQLDNESKRFANAVAGDLATWVTEHPHAMPAMKYRELTANVANIAQNTAVAESEEALKNIQKEIAELQKKVVKYDGDLAERMTTNLEDIVNLKLQKIREEVRSEHNLGTMYSQQGTAAMMNAKTNQDVAAQNIEESKSRVRLNDQTFDLNQPDEVIAAIEQSAKSTSYYEFMHKLNIWVSEFPVVKQIIEAFGGSSAAYAGARLGSSAFSSQDESHTETQIMRDSEGRVEGYSTHRTGVRSGNSSSNVRSSGSSGRSKRRFKK